MRRVMPIQTSGEDYSRVARGEKLVRVREVPWEIFTEAHERQSQRNHSQTLNRIAERGGFSACEMLAVLACSKWHKMDVDYSHLLLYSMIVAFNRGGLLANNDQHPTHPRAVTA